VGNSLGGLYSRYAVPRLKDILQQQTSHAATISNRKLMQTSNKTLHQIDNPQHNAMFIHGTQLFFNIFCTTASPHLGIADHTYIPIPRTAGKSCLA
jgi:hypothetical protein